MKSIKSIFLFFLLGTAATRGQNAATLSIDLNHPKGKVSPTLYGLMTEEINYSYEGGLYAQFIRTPMFVPGWDQPAHWFLMPRGNAQVSFALDKSVFRLADREISLRVDVKQADAANFAELGNEGYWGIPVRPSTTYKAIIYAKGQGVGAITASLVNDDTGQVLASATTGEPVEGNWREYNLDLITGRDAAVSASNRFVLSFAHAGTIWLDYVSLKPAAYHNRANGTRIDLMEKLAAMRPAFLRFPGGNYVEGNQIADRFEWKNTLGNPADRPGHMSPWGYPSSDGFGLLEFLEWCEDLHMQPVLAVYAGYSLGGQHVDPGSALQPYVEDALDEIEYVTGDVASKWGAQRARNGHPEPFPLHYVEIGNEDVFDKSGSYDGRFAQFYKAIKTKYPALQLIATTKVTGTPDVIDEHYYRRAEEMFANAGQYDKADRNGPKIFVGEWATREGTPTSDMNAALGDAAWMTGLERNSDLIIMSCYAPLFVNVDPGGMQWATDLIGYDALRSYGSPSYYAQVLFSNHLGDEILNGKLETNDPRVFYSATRDSKSGTIYLKIVNASTAPLQLKIKPEANAAISNTATWWTLKGASQAQTNSIEKPEEITPSEHHITNLNFAGFQRFDPLSINVIEIRPD